MQGRRFLVERRILPPSAIGNLPIARHTLRANQLFLKSDPSEAWREAKFRRQGVIGASETRTQGAFVAVLRVRLRTTYRSA
jgi:hypothetical protein